MNVADLLKKYNGSCACGRAIVRVDGAAAVIVGKYIDGNYELTPEGRKIADAAKAAPKKKATRKKKVAPSLLDAVIPTPPPAALDVKGDGDN